VLANGCLFLPASHQPILLHNTVYLCVLVEVFCLTMSGNALHCKNLINAVQLQLPLWEQSDKNYQNRDLKFKIWEVAGECDYSCKYKFRIFQVASKTSLIM
jgi:hypothetical protein